VGRCSFLNSIGCVRVYRWRILGVIQERLKKYLKFCRHNVCVVVYIDFLWSRGSGWSTTIVFNYWESFINVITRARCCTFAGMAQTFVRGEGVRRQLRINVIGSAWTPPVREWQLWSINCVRGERDFWLGCDFSLCWHAANTTWTAYLCSDQFSFVCFFFSLVRLWPRVSLGMYLLFCVSRSEHTAMLSWRRSCYVVVCVLWPFCPGTVFFFFLPSAHSNHGIFV